MFSRLEGVKVKKYKSLSSNDQACENEASKDMRVYHAGVTDGDDLDGVGDGGRRDGADDG
jgi:hypothetical protein